MEGKPDANEADNRSIHNKQPLTKYINLIECIIVRQVYPSIMKVSYLSIVNNLFIGNTQEAKDVLVLKVFIPEVICEETHEILAKVAEVKVGKRDGEYSEEKLIEEMENIMKGESYG